MKGGAHSGRIAMTVAALALGSCGSSGSGGAEMPQTSDPDAASANSDGGAWAGTGNPGVNGGSSTADGATLGCTGAMLDDDNWDTCPEAVDAGPNCDCNGYGPDGGALTSSGGAVIFDVTSFRLPIAMTAGELYAFSFAVSDNRFYGDIELWGTTGTCGPGFERLYAAPVASKTYCVNVVASESYPYVLLVQRLSVDGGGLASFSASQFTACPTDRCP